MTSAAEEAAGVSQRRSPLPRNRIALFIERYIRPVFVRKFTIQVSSSLFCSY